MKTSWLAVLVLSLTVGLAPMGADASQLFLFQHREKWAPSGPPPGAGGPPKH